MILALEAILMYCGPTVIIYCCTLSNYYFSSGVPNTVIDVRTLCRFKVEAGRKIDVCVEVGLDAFSFGRALFGEKSELFVYKVIDLETSPEAQTKAILKAAFVREKPMTI